MKTYPQNHFAKKEKKKKKKRRKNKKEDEKNRAALQFIQSNTNVPSLLVDWRGFALDIER